MKTNKPKSAKKAKPQLTVNELQTWLDGYCSAHGAEWAPTLEQWKIIKGKIFSLSDEERPSAPVYANTYNPEYDQNRPADSYTRPVNYNNPAHGVTTIEMPSYESSIGREMVGVSDRPAMTVKGDGTLVMPSNFDDKLPPSSFA